MNLKSLLVFFVFALGPVAVFAQSTLEMKEQAAARLEKSDKAMNVAYQQLIKVLNEEGVKRLKATQRAWIAYRDAQASFDCHQLAGGTMEGLEELGSLNQLTQERTKRLKEDLERFK